MNEFLDPNEYVSLVGIDPGTTKLGISRYICKADLSSVVGLESFTIEADRLPLSPWTIQNAGARRARLDCAEYAMTKYFQKWKPIAFASEAPFYNMKRPNAFSALLESIGAIQKAMNEYDPKYFLHLIDPPTVKRAVGAPGNADKEKMKKTIKEHPFFGHQTFVNIDALDEHSLDSLAVAHCLFRAIYDGQVRLPTYF
jgi:Holliday junction resolvasome RuvABC endonuclease subunit